MPRLFLGLMSGTSVDGIDAAVVRVWGNARRLERVEVVYHGAFAWPRELRERLLAVMAPAATTTQEICELNMLVGVEFARAANAAIRKSGIKREQIEAIGSHGQTVCHLPPRATGAMGSTMQLGDASVIAALTGVRTVGNFRVADMAVGGQGAPLVPWTDALMFGGARGGKVARCVQNIGGIANVTWLPKKGKGDYPCKVLAFDTGPGNMLMDGVVRLGTGGKLEFDRGGRLAQKGNVLEGLLRELKDHTYFARRPPKSTGREEFGEGMARKLYRRVVGKRQVVEGTRDDASGRRSRGKLEDLVCTLTALTAWSIVDAYQRFLPEPPDEVILCGGGAENPVLVGMMRAELMELGKAIRVRRIDDLGIPNKAKEAASFALLAMAHVDGVAGNLPSVTGARTFTVLGEAGE